jgi:hypothetical protein
MPPRKRTTQLIRVDVGWDVGIVVLEINPGLPVGFDTEMKPEQAIEIGQLLIRGALLANGGNKADPSPRGKRHHAT